MILASSCQSDCNICMPWQAITSTHLRILPHLTCVRQHTKYEQNALSSRLKTQIGSILSHMYFITFNGQPARYTSIWVNPQEAAATGLSAATAQPIHKTLTMHNNSALPLKSLYSFRRHLPFPVPLLLMPLCSVTSFALQVRSSINICGPITGRPP